ncbi:CBS domain containing membrane protein [Beutenbergia cavernae DSM 12333]|uniref:CBS domain containing membrane protein n=1 Tax=Beutenbergia cavernae (strain ATCC BAA-8 / DSM 12333 / CCUG 43141 / JCM 11478 / NBRC 16432 / NCIMB 13614 / HKI 0122) TaxID=471853 RepID=C5BZB3_BEUC1|nr:CBS domain-containing protein [Beutenbergia cavernae]ACQ79085.1 CBS domain containing membrane protein [Beutenbergia cavernae DSM 12333]
MRIADVIRRKGADVFTVSPETTVAELVAELDSRRIGALVVSVDGGETVSGIVSERDVVRHLHVDGAAVLQRPVADIMTEKVETCVPEDEIESLARRMTDLRVRHLPVVVDGRLKAIVSIGDVVKNRLDELQDERDQLVGYVQS